MKIGLWIRNLNDFPILKVIDANLDSDKVYKQIKCIIEQFFICEYSSVPNRRVGHNKRAGGKILRKD